jgi:ATP-dependent Clp protease ATP-binding subunit ClpB
VNRIDDIVRFRSLTEVDLERIVDIQMQGLIARLAQRRIRLEVTPAGRRAIASEGFEPAFGARPLKRVIQREIADKLALALLEGTYGEGDTVVVDATSDGELTLR